VSVEYWKLQGDQLLNSLGTSAQGLETAEAGRRLQSYGRNEIAPPERRTAFSMFASQFRNPLVYVLIFASIVAAFLGEVTETTIIIAIVLINAVLGFVQEYRSEKAVQELKKYITYRARVIRGGKLRVIDIKDLVRGDMVLLAIGDVVPADIRLTEADELQTNESILTGESNPVEKATQALDIDKPMPHQLSNTALMGSEVVNGSGKGVVVSTGRATYFGRVASGLSLLPPATDFQKNIASFGNLLVRVIAILTIFVFAVNSLLGHGVLDSLLFSVALAVGIIPEALPVVITVGLSDGALRLVKKKVVVKRLEAIEDIGNVDVLCTDKTGTLTQNEITVEDIIDTQGHSRPGLVKYALLCNTAVVEGGRILGNPIDAALWKYARAIGYDETHLKECYLVQEVPFGFNRRRMSSVVEEGGQRVLISKGAPESILTASTSTANSAGGQSMSSARPQLDALIESYIRAGKRVIAIGSKAVEKKPRYSPDDEKDLTVLGLAILSDPPKEDAAEAISRFKSLGIRLKILSGDDPLVTADICRRLGVEVGEKVLTGMELETLAEEDLRKTVEKDNVFGRVTPEQKLMIVEALKKNGHVVGFLGDGVNDAPSLRLADAGISVDSGVQVAKEASSIILLEKSLNVVADGVVEGRKAFGNMVKYIMNTTSANFGNMLTVALGSLFLPFIPLLPSQILLTNLLSDAPLLTISTDNLDPEGLSKPRRWAIGSVARFMVFFGLISSIFDMITIVFLIDLLRATPALFRTGWFIESVVSEIVVTFSIRTRRKFFESKPSKLLVIASVLGVLLTGAVIYSPLDVLFEFVRPPAWFLALVFGILAMYFLLVEILKHAFQRRYEV
jgi:Mg2+-importing ATPase